MFKKLTNKKLMIALVIVIVAVIFNKQILEGFRQGRRFFWGFSEPRRNSTHDIRGEKDIRTKFIPKETGAFYESAIYPNFSKNM